MSGLLTPEIVARIGDTVTYTAPEEIGSASIRYFAIAVGDLNPIYLDEASARAAGYDGIIAPPTFVVETNQYMVGSPDDTGYMGHSWDLDVPGTRMIRGGHEYVLGQPAKPSDILTVTWKLASVEEKHTSSGRQMLVVSSQARYENQDGDLLAVNSETMIYEEVG